MRGDPEIVKNIEWNGENWVDDRFWGWQCVAISGDAFKKGLLVICLTFLNAWKQMLSVGKHFSEKKVHAYFTCSKFSELGKSLELINS